MVKLEKFQQVQNLLNNEEAEQFKNFYHAKFFRGDITLIEEDQAITLTFHKGTCIEVIDGIPDTGIDIGVSGTKEAWDGFEKHLSLSVATNKQNPTPLQPLGGAIRFRQNFNVVAQLVRIYGKIRSEKEAVSWQSMVSIRK